MPINTAPGNRPCGGGQKARLDPVSSRLFANSLTSDIVLTPTLRALKMLKSLRSTLLEVIAAPITRITDAIDPLTNTSISNRLKRDVFEESYVRSLDKISQNKNLYPGNVMRVSRRGYWHYGVYVGNDEVVHFTSKESDTSDDNSIMKTPMEGFLKGEKLFDILGFPDTVENTKVLSKEDTRDRALSQIGKASYCLKRNNC
ncbi:hypothetical protein HG264_16585 [Pseudomonas sp. gcc21]|uniref:lecithin retinol acyltransferase family protein n=1 Tax=Pseudomonas sp. gcc21 TaxID=2726989 RepID=UPI001451A3A2|nr:lecithin retinol acyltransferase family protein [Pseudomonas sp. gcc21]QJD60375.1 hypothetical protein HG264_16585 [Pseudomonas sp. gcc21]